MFFIFHSVGYASLTHPTSLEVISTQGIDDLGGFKQPTLNLAYFSGHVLVHTTYDSLQALSVSVLNPI